MRFYGATITKKKVGLFKSVLLVFVFVFVRKCKGGATDISVESQGRVG